MNGLERQWLLVVFVCASLLTLFTANALPFRDENAGFGIKDDPAESQALSLSERDTNGENSPDKTLLSDVAGLAENITTNTTANTTNTPTTPELQNTTNISKPLNNSSLNVTTDALNKTKFSTNLTTTASPQNVSTVRVFANRTGNPLPSTSIQSNHVNITINPSQSIKIVPKSSSGSTQSTYTNSLKPSHTPTPTVNSVKLSGTTSSSMKLNPSHSVAILANRTTGVSSVVSTAVPSIPPSAQNATRIPTTVQNTSGAASTKRPSGTPPTHNETGSTQTPSGAPIHSSSGAPSTQHSSSAPSTQHSSGGPSTQSSSSAPSTQHSSGAPSTQSSSSAPSTQNPSTKSATKITKPSSPASEKLPTTSKLSTLPSTGVASSSPPTTEIKTPASTAKNVISKKPTSKMPTQESTKKPSTKARVKPTTKDASTAPTTTEAISTVPKKPTTNAKPKTTKKATTKADVATKKPTAVKTKANTENNDEGRMPPPDQGREAVLWDFIVPVAIGTGVALAIAFGVILVRTCRRRKLIKVRFGGKPSHPRLLNNDLINLLAESDDEEEE